VTTTAAAAGIRRHTGTYPAEPRQVGVARAALAGWLGGGPQADEAVLVASEFATNSVLHSSSKHGGAFTLRAEVSRDRLRIEVEDAGGPWCGGARDDGRPHGFDVVAAIAGPGNWASTGTPAGVSPGPGSAGDTGGRPTASC
jgi:anti-sigma regulatory factor (Ser/Thr protein kinase)